MAAPEVNTDAEAALIGACLTTRQAVEAAFATGITAAMFIGKDHGTIWQAITDLHADEHPIDPITVASRMGHYDDRLAWASTLVELQAGPNVPANAHQYSTAVRDAWRERHITFELQACLNGSRPNWRARYDALVAEVDSWDTPTDNTGPWTPIDLAACTGGAENPYILTRSDGTAIFYIGKVNSLSGPPESAKSWLALVAHAELAKRGAHSAYIDYEDNPESVSYRLRLIGLTDAELQLVHYFWPDNGLDHALAALEALDVPLDLVTVDSNTRATIAAGAKTNSTDDAAIIGRTLARIARTLGAGVILLDHVTKDDDPDSPYSRGAGDKLAYIDGAAYKVKILSLFAPGRTGKSEITCVKDRPGGARKNFKNGRGAAHFTLTSDDEEAVEIALDPIGELPGERTDDGDWRPTVYMERLSRALELRPEGVGVKEIRTLIEGKRNGVKDLAARFLVTEGYVEIIPGPHGAKLHKSVKQFRAEPDTDE